MKTHILFFASLFLSFLSNAQTPDTIKTKSGLKYIQLVKGTGELPTNGQKVKVYYHKGMFLNGKEFDKEVKMRIIRFTLGNQEVIPGWDEGFKLMRKGEKGILIIPAKLAYGHNGVLEPDEENIYRIPPDTDLIFEVELLDFK